MLEETKAEVYVCEPMDNDYSDEEPDQPHFQGEEEPTYMEEDEDEEEEEGDTVAEEGEPGIKKKRRRKRRKERSPKAKGFILDGVKVDTRKTYRHYD
jgi:hypothetical protein